MLRSIASSSLGSSPVPEHVHDAACALPVTTTVPGSTPTGANKKREVTSAATVPDSQYGVYHLCATLWSAVSVCTSVSVLHRMSVLKALERFPTCYHCMILSFSVIVLSLVAFPLLKFRKFAQ